MPIRVGNTDATIVYIREQNPQGGYIMTEAKEIKTASGTLSHKRVDIIFYRNYSSSDTTVLYSQVKTWKVESVTKPSNPTRAGYTFEGWSTTRTATVPNVSFPVFVTSSSTLIYYAVWKRRLTTSAPTISVYRLTTARITNNDNSTATIYADSKTSPTVNLGLVSPGKYVDKKVLLLPNKGTTIYAKAEADGKNPSPTVSQYFYSPGHLDD